MEGCCSIKSRAKRLMLTVALLLAVAALSWAMPMLAQERRPELSIRIISEYRGLDLAAGADNRLSVQVGNVGDAPLKDVTLGVDVPVDWQATLSTSRISQLGPRSVETVDLTVRPPRQISRREVKIVIRADAGETSQVHHAWVTVKSPRWLLIAGAMVLAVILAFVVVFISQTRDDPAILHEQRREP